MYVNRRFYDKYVSTRDVELLHEYSLRVLKEVGVSFDCPEALEIFKKHGATVEGSIVKIDEDLLNKALETAPKTFTVYTAAGETKSANAISQKQLAATDHRNSYLKMTNTALRKKTTWLNS